MQDVFVELLTILGAVYVFECFRWVSRSAVLIREVPGFGSWVSAPWQGGSQLRRALAFGFPLPFGSLFEVEAMPLRLMPACVVVPVFDRRGWAVPTVHDTVIPWRALGGLVVAGAELKLSGRVLHVFGSKGAAAATRALLEALRKVADQPEKRRRAEIEKQVAARFSKTEASAMLERWSDWRGPVRVANTLLFVALFGGLAQFVREEEAFIKPWLAAALLAWVLAIGVNVFAVRRVLPAERWPTALEWVMALVSPLALMRASDLVEGELLGGIEPAVVEVLLLSAAAARGLLLKERQELRHPLRYESVEALELAGDAWLRGLREKYLGRLLDQLPNAPVETPQPGERACPRCLTAYSREAVECRSCPGVRLA